MIEIIEQAGSLFTKGARTQLLIEVEQLSGRYLAELEIFVQYLKFKQAGTERPSGSRSRVLPPEADPLLRVLGAIDAAPFAEAIDDMLYSVL